MRRNRWSRYSVFAACCLTLLFSGLAIAQDHPRRGTVDVPFDFYISGNKLPAGQYTLDVIAPTYLMLRSQDGKVQQDLYFMQTATPGKNPISQVVFAQRDGKYYFAEVWSWFGKAQLTSFTPKAGDQTKDVPLRVTEKDAKPAPGL
jgi:hypothetical protein